MSDNQKSEPAAPTLDPRLSQFHKWMNKHLVSLVLIYWHLDEKGNSKGEPLVAACSGFVMSFGETWFLVTAGHVLNELDQLIAHRFVKVVDCFIVDSLGSQARHLDNIPFDYEQSIRHAVYHEGLDFGLILLSPKHQRLMQANDIQPVGVEHWITQDIDRCKGFALLGIPAKLVMLEDRDKPGLNIGTVIIALKRLRQLPDRADDTKYERFIGEILKRGELDSLEGTSGGPIIGFFDHKGRTHCWIVALQSHSLDNRYVFGCPVKLFGQFLLEELRKALNELESTEA